MFQIKKGLQTKLVIAFGSFGIICVLTAGGGYDAIRRIRSLHHLSSEFTKARLDLASAIEQERSFVSEERSNVDFFETKQSENQEGFQTAIDNLSSRITRLKKHPNISDFSLSTRLNRLESQIEEYNTAFTQLQHFYLERGFKNYGAEGVLRVAIHGVEESEFPFELADLLMLRRHEKDFFLRHDTKYQVKFHRDLAAFNQRIQEISNSNPELKASQKVIADRLKEYRFQFDKIVELEKSIGFGQTAGLLNKVSAIENQVNLELMNIQHLVSEQVAKSEKTTIHLFLVATLVLLLFGIFLTLRFTWWLSRPILAIKDRIVELSNGSIPEPFRKINTDEIGQAKEAFNNLVERIKTATGFARNVGDGQLDSQYPQAFANDVLSLALQDMQSQLQGNAKVEHERQWMAEGLNRISDLLRKNQQNFNLLGKSLVAELSQYLNANQVALYLVKNDKETSILDRVATYAFDRQKFQTDRIEVGEGMVGTCWLEKAPIFITDVPHDYFHIRSGLGGATPTSVYILPLIANDKVLGVVELAAFHVFSEVEIQLLDRMADHIATTLAFTYSNEQTSQLFQEQISLAADLRSQEEELRQNQEEVDSTQKELSKQLKNSHSILQKKEELIESLESQLARLEVQQAAVNPLPKPDLNERLKLN